MKTCDGCIYAQWQRTSNGRLHPNKTGRCTFAVKVPALPAAFYWHLSEPRPAGGYIERGRQHSEQCAYYARDPRPTPAAPSR